MRPQLAASIAAAQARLPHVVLADEELERIAGVCASFEVDGLRADIVIARTAAAHAAWHGRSTVNREDIRVAALLALPHRRRRNPFDAPGLDEEQLDDALGEDPGPDDEPDPQPPGQGPRRRRTRRNPARRAVPVSRRPGAGRRARRRPPTQEQAPARGGGTGVGRGQRRDLPRAAA